MLDSTKSKIFIGVAWPYVNGDIHVGHYAGYLLPCDIAARYHRLRGRDVLMVSGSDCFGTPITIQADKEKTTPQAIVEEYHPKVTQLFAQLGISYDLYTKTDTPLHKEIVQEFFLAFLNKGFIFKDFSEQYYSEVEHRFLPDRYVEGICPNCKAEGTRSDQCEVCGALLNQGELLNPVSRNTKTEAILKKTEHYFIDWSKLQPFLKDYVGSAEGWRGWVSQETKGWLTKGLKPRPVTRDLDWGVELPVDCIPENLRIENIESKRLYVWFDAVIGYFSASLEWARIRGDKDAWKAFWYGDDVYHYYFMGKDNLTFHTLFWPGQLHVYDDKLHLPDVPVVNQFLNLEGQKFSKSRGVVLNIQDLVQEYGNDPLRFYLCSILPENSDSDFKRDEFKEKINTVLIANFGNFINRVLTLAKDVDLSAFTQDDLRPDCKEQVRKTFEDTYDYLDSCRFKETLEKMLALSASGNALMSATEPWKLKATNPPEFEKLMFSLVYIASALAYLSAPLLIETKAKLAQLLGVEISAWPELSKLEESLLTYTRSVKITNIKPLFSKLD